MKKLPVLQQAKVVIIPLFFVFAYCQGWVGRWGLIMGAFSKSYFDMLAVPFRWWPRSPAFGKALIYNQFYVDTFFKIIGYVINVAKGKAKFPPEFKTPTLPTPPGVVDTTTGDVGNPYASASPFGAAAPPSAPRQTTATVMPPTMPTTASPPQPERPSGPPPRSAPPIVDADVTFLD